MTRMSRDWLGGEGPRPTASRTCMIVTWIFIASLIINAILSLAADSVTCFGGDSAYVEDATTGSYSTVIICPDGTTEAPNTAYQAITTTASVFSIIFAVYVFFIACRTRAYMRQKYQIPAKCCGDAEDCCCVFWCSCCSVSINIVLFFFVVYSWVFDLGGTAVAAACDGV